MNQHATAATYNNTKFLQFQCSNNNTVATICWELMAKTAKFGKALCGNKPKIEVKRSQLKHPCDTGAVHISCECSTYKKIILKHQYWLICLFPSVFVFL